MELSGREPTKDLSLLPHDRLLIFSPAQTTRAAKRGVRVAWMCSYLRLMPDDKALGWRPKQPAPSNIE
jgi:hypothetical protein